MGRRKTLLVVQQGSTRVQVEHVKSRRALRLILSHEPGTDLEPVEIPLQDLIDQLSLAPADLGQTLYLLFAARQDQGRHGGSRPLVRTFASQTEGRAAFMGLRESAAFAVGGWAELVAVEPSGRVKQVCWVGEKGATAVPAEGSEKPRPGRWGRRGPGSPDELR